MNKTIIKLKADFDSENIFSVIESLPMQIAESFHIVDKISLNNMTKDIKSILICGMGGSAIGGELARIIAFDLAEIPIVVNKSNLIPEWVNKQTLVIISSYSGNTYETIEALNFAKQKKAIIICICSKGGKLETYSQNYNYITINIPKGLQPRCALGYSSSMLLLLFVKLGLINQSIKQKLYDAVIELKKINKEHNKILAFCNKIKGTVPIIYGSENLTSIAAIRFKNQLQENAKMLSFHNTFPEINHNEIEGWGNKNHYHHHIVWLLDCSYDLKINRCIDLSYDLLNNLGINQTKIEMQGQNKLERLYKMIFYLDWTSYYLALLNNVNPSSINNINYIKNQNI